MKADKMYVLDADSHWSEPGDLFTSRAPAAWKDRMPRVENVEVPNFIDGHLEMRDCWVCDGTILGQHSAAGVVDRDGNKENPHKAMFEWPFDMIHRGAYDPKARIEVLDDCGIDAQVIYPSTIGLGGHFLGKNDDRSISEMAIRIYNDAQAEIQAESGNRLLGLPIMPSWDVAACVTEVRRVAELGARGINMCSEPSDLGGPDLAQAAWDPFWEVCAALHMPVHFHIGASVSAKSWHNTSWASHSNDTKLAIGGAMQFIGNSQVAINFLVSGIFDRHPALQVVLVECGIGWIPFLCEAIEYEMAENAPDDFKRLRKRPMEYFRDNMFATFWFETNQGRLPELVERVGEDNILFETDFPHPTCLYPNPLGTVADKIATLTPRAQAKILGENGRKLYRL